MSRISLGEDILGTHAGLDLLSCDDGGHHRHHWNEHVHSAILKWTPNKDLLYSRWNSAQCCVAAWMRATESRKFQFPTDASLEAHKVPGGPLCSLVLFFPPASVFGLMLPVTASIRTFTLQSGGLRLSLLSASQDRTPGPFHGPASSCSLLSQV